MVKNAVHCALGLHFPGQLEHTVLAAKTVGSESFCSLWIFWTILDDSEAQDIIKMIRYL